MSHHKLKRLRVHGGFLDRLDLNFTDGLNCIIGGRGSGKTTVLELVRFGLDRLPRPTSPAGKAAEERIRALITANLGPGGRVELEFESQEGLTYQIRRTAHDPPTITDARGKPVDPAVLGSTILIDAAIFSHNQIEEIAGNPAAQRELIDRLCAQALHALNAKITQAQGALRESAQRLLQLDTRMSTARQELVDLSSWESKLAAADATIAGAGVAPHYKGAAEERELRERERASLSAAHKAVHRLHEHLGPATLDQVRALAELIPAAVQRGPNAAIFGDLARELSRRQTELEILLSPLVERLAALAASLEQSRHLLAQLHDPQEARYRELMKEADAHASGLNAREEAAREVLRLSGVKAELLALAREINEAGAARAALLASYEGLRRERFAQRGEIAAAVSARLGGKVRVIVTADADLSAYREYLAILMKKSGRQYNAPIDKIIAAVAPGELGEIADRNDPGALAASADINGEFAESLLQNLREHRERRLELDVLDRQDVPRIELNIGGEWRSADRLSTGQKSSAILPILLLESEAPLFIDQPEDNLDNSFISDAVVPQIREIKRRRQILMITHNPNLPVLGDAERVIVLEADGRSARALVQGDVHAAKEHILRLMEGGRDAFRLRGERYERP